MSTSARHAHFALTCLFGAAIAALPATAHAAEFDFSCITNNSGVCGTLDDFFTGELLESGSQVSFQFWNDKPPTSTALDTGVIADLYFDDDNNLLGTPTIINGAGVNFTLAGSPNNLPAGNTITFSATDDFHASNPSPVNGVGNGETLTILFTLNGTTIFPTIVNALHGGTLRIGLHVQSLLGPGDFSESMVNSPGTTVTPIPEPASMILLGSGLAGLAAYSRRRREQRA